MQNSPVRGHMQSINFNNAIDCAKYDTNIPTISKGSSSHISSHKFSPCEVNEFHKIWTNKLQHRNLFTEKVVKIEKCSKNIKNEILETIVRKKPIITKQ